MDRILRDAGGELDLTTYDTAGVPANVDGANVPTVVVTDSAGVVAAGFTGAKTGTGTYNAPLPANFETLDTYEAVWTWPNAQSRRSEFELVGGFIFTIADLKAFDTQLSSLATSVLYGARAMVEDVFEDERITNRAFRPRGRRFTRDGTGTDRMMVPDYDVYSLVSASVDAIDLTAPELADVKIEAHGELVRNSGMWSWGIMNVSVLYEFGMRSTPAKVRLEALKFARSLLLVSPMEEGRATAVLTDIGGYRVTTPGRDGPTGIPSVDATLAQFSRAGLTVA